MDDPTRETGRVMNAARGTGRWVIEFFDEEDEEWVISAWRGISLAFAMKELRIIRDPAKGKHQYKGHEIESWRIRDVDTNDIIMGDIL